jgi:hypothetical protein
MSKLDVLDDTELKAVKSFLNLPNVAKFHRYEEEAFLKTFAYCVPEEKWFDALQVSEATEAAGVFLGLEGLQAKDRLIDHLVRVKILQRTYSDYPCDVWKMTGKARLDFFSNLPSDWPSSSPAPIPEEPPPVPENTGGPQKIFLSHNGVDKPRVREFFEVLRAFGFDPWLDEDAMKAGAVLERAIRKGFTDSCAAVFFVTPHYKDEEYIASEINYAIEEKRTKKERFTLITIVLPNKGEQPEIPVLLRPYVWKTPRSDLEALLEIINALPIETANFCWRSTV